jgi:AcrR family transcriptional regulator
MTSPKDPAVAPRRRDAAGSRQALLDAARTLFNERGFDRTTIRDIGELAGLDPTLIARYFGSKSGLYLAILRTDFAAEESDSPRDLFDPERMIELLDRVQRRGPGPVVASALRADGDPSVHDEALAAFTERLVDPLVRRLESGGVSESRLRAELVAAAFVGVAVGRHADAFPTLSGAPAEQIAALLLDSLGRLEDPPSRAT